MAHEFKLGPPLLKTGDAGHLPDTWRADLLSKHLDGPSRVAVAQTCSTALQWVLEEHTSATLQLTVRAPSTESKEQLAKRLQAAAQQLQLRGNHDTVLVLQQQGQIDKDDPWWKVRVRAQRSLCTQARLPRRASHFHGGTQCFANVMSMLLQAFFGALAGPVSPNFTLTLQPQHITAALLAAVGQAFAGLTSLSLGSATDSLGSYIEVLALPKPRSSHQREPTRGRPGLR